MEDNNLHEQIKKFGYTIALTSYENEEDTQTEKFKFRAWRIPEENHKIEDTHFFYSKETEFIHFTSLDALHSILTTKHIRLYNLTNMDDKLEMEYARRELNFQQPVNKAKEDIFCFSMCSAESVLSDPTKEHILWKLHGRNGYGVIIKFEILNRLQNWYHYHLTKTYYGTEDFQPIKEFNQTIDNERLDNKICCFIKPPIYKFEEEIRLIFNSRDITSLLNHGNELLYPKKYPDKLTSPDNILYFQLPLANFPDKTNPDQFLAPNFQGQNYEIPKLKITEIILGYRYSENDRISLMSKLHSLIKPIPIKITPLSEFY